MGQYFKIVNKTKKQVLEPMTFGSGCKHGEIISNADRGSVLQALGHLITTCSGGWGEWDESTSKFTRYKGTWAGDEIIMVGDYHESKLYDKAGNQRWYKDISEEVMFELLHERLPDYDDLKVTDKAHTKGFRYSWIGQDVRDMLKKHGTSSLWGERKRMLLKWFPIACHEGNLRQKYDFVESEDFKSYKEIQEEHIANGQVGSDHYNEIKDL
tara:strand:- start:15502 stop:16137 length:636 start_codon:yes stop_codon:yes gene_type:complete